ncbi:glycosyltransferase family 4 protein [Paenibacillus sp.]|jgi:glycosyltransferase involved in cell wall biosynthesis|uniref:glycosyltransferase family 4 protein n=1 Tax=Paenibacillus sp. TaxID=58172 RepID=UPI00282EE0AC|nr:glycosyltransferase family 4 protein [Paenibacillus sp.]MDR0268704.1 glycosyltransferase family 4 protein [Paenibacillus sp.]
MIHALRQNEFLNRNSRLPLAKPQAVELSSRTQNKKMRVVYVMTHVGICGGVKIIFEHANRLKEQGWEVCIVSRFPKPDWYPVFVEYQQVPFGIELAKGIPLCDVIVATYWDHIQACIETGIAPVVYFEQGDEHLFHLYRLSDMQQTFVKTQMKLPQFIMTVSHQAASLLEENFGQMSVVIPNAIDHSVFNEEENYTGNARNSQYILMIGSENVRFKGVSVIVKAVQKVREYYPEMELYWINPKNPSEAWISTADQVFVNPPQDKIAELFRNATLFVSASEFESFSLPVLEAMATGCPVVSTNNAGVLEYGIDNGNIIFSEIGNEDDLVQKILLALGNSDLRNRISKNGLSTAKKYNWQNTITQLSEYLTSVSNYVVISNQSIDDWDIKLDVNNFLNPQEFERFTKSLQNISEDIIYIPVVYNWVEDHPIARWEIAATRKMATNQKSIRIFTPAFGGVEDMRQVALGEGIQCIMEERYNEALDYFVTQYATLSDDWKLPCSKWIILCLIELNRDKEALKVIDDVLRVNEKFSDAYYLYYILLCFYNSEQSNQVAQTISLIGESVSENEWFFDLNARLKNNPN